MPHLFEVRFLDCFLGGPEPPLHDPFLTSSAAQCGGAVSGTCYNGGRCYTCQVYAGIGFIYCCSCPGGFSGSYCENDLNTCRSSPCQNGGTCINGVNGFTCTCLREYIGLFCESADPNLSCQPGYYKGPSGTCSQCSAGTYSLGIACISCQQGTFSNVSGATTPTNCQLCGNNSYSATAGSTSCSPCSGSCAAGSMMSSPCSPIREPPDLIIVDESGHQYEPTNPPVVPGLLFVWAFLGFVGCSVIVTILFRKWLGEGISAASVVLKTPFSAVRVIHSSDTLSEVPSLIRGTIGLWVIAGVIVITAYQVEVFLFQGRAEISSVQPGIVFSNGAPISSANTSFFVSLVLFQTPVTCNSSQYALSFFGSNIQSTGTISGPPTSCVVDSTIPSLNLTYTFSAPITFGGDSAVVFKAVSNSGSPIFSHGVSYEVQVNSYNKRNVSMTETLTNDAIFSLVGDTTVVVSAIPTEYLYETEVRSIGYTYAHFSSVVDTVTVPASDTVLVTFSLLDPGYLYQIRNIQAISYITFFSGIVALGAGVITAGSLLANIFSTLHHRWRVYRRDSKPSTEHSVPLL